MEKELEALDKLEECANGMKDLPKSNWIDLANSEAELDLKIMDWVETIKFELFKGKQALTELKQIKEAKPSEAMECSLKLYKMVESAGNGNGFSLNEAWKYHNTIKQALLKAQEQEKVLEVIKKKKVDIKLVLWAGNMVEAYNQQVREQKDYWWREELTQEEFDLLKRWCEKCQK